jgi:hypothetical protein
VKRYLWRNERSSLRSRNVLRVALQLEVTLDILSVQYSLYTMYARLVTCLVFNRLYKLFAFNSLVATCPSTTMSKRKSSVGSDCAVPAKQIRTSGRATRGQGGRTDQLTKVGQALTAKPLRKAKDSRSTDEPVNPMAPKYLEDSRAKQRSLKVCIWFTNFLIRVNTNIVQQNDAAPQTTTSDNTVSSMLLRVCARLIYVVGQGYQSP